MPFMKKQLSLLLIFGLIVFQFSCTKQRSLQDTEEHLNLPEIPFNYKETGHLFGASSDKLINNHKATLGRVLFYDKKLSLNRTVSCGSCHLQANAFSDITAQSEGFNGELTKRNTLPLFNFRFKNRFLWDGRANELGEVALMAFTNPIEMGMPNESAIVDRVKESDYYRVLFESAFNNHKISFDKISLALTEFLKTIASFESKFDYGNENDFENFSQLELDGFTIYKDSQCDNCHKFSINGWEGRNNGLILDELDQDGFYVVRKQDKYKGLFYSPELRNIALTAPYMHDGRFVTLEEVIEHYSTRIMDHPNLSSSLKVGSLGAWNSTESDTPQQENGEPIKFNYTEYEKQALLAFMHTLTDEELISAEKFSDPFIK